jgi:hypothetical protein
MSWFSSEAAARGRMIAALLPGKAAILGGCATVLALCGVCSLTALAAGKVSVRLEGDVAPECDIAGAAAGGTATLGIPLDVGDVSRPGSKAYGFSLNCNAPFTYRLEAQYGALIHAAATGASVPNANTAIAYDVAILIPTDGPPIDDRCSGESIRAGTVSCPFSTSGNSIALGSQARITITWRPPGSMPLAGAYVERLTVTVATSL